MNCFVRPDSCVLTLANEQTIIVRERLNTGETLRMRDAIQGADDRQAKSDRAAFSLVLAYLLDWTFTLDGRPVVIRDQPADVVRGALEQLEYDVFVEMAQAVLAHVKQQDARRAEEKKTPTTAPGSPATLPSPYAVVGGTNG